MVRKKEYKIIDQVLKIKTADVGNVAFRIFEDDQQINYKSSRRGNIIYKDDAYEIGIPEETLGKFELKSIKTRKVIVEGEISAVEVTKLPEEENEPKET